MYICIYVYIYICICIYICIYVCCSQQITCPVSSPFEKFPRRRKDQHSPSRKGINSSIAFLLIFTGAVAVMGATMCHDVPRCASTSMVTVRLPSAIVKKVAKMFIFGIVINPCS